MSSSAAFLEFRYSGGAANILQLDCLGGQIADYSAKSQAVTVRSGILNHITPDDPTFQSYISSMSFLKASGFSSAFETLTTTSLIYHPYTKRAWLGQPVAISGGYSFRDETKAVYLDSDGRFFLQDNDVLSGWVIVDVVTNPAAPTNISPSLYFLISLKIEAASFNEMWDNISKVESKVGDIEYRCFYVKNNGIDYIYNVRLYIKSQPASTIDTLQIGLDPIGIGNGSTTGVATSIANEGVAPGGVVFTSADVNTPLAIGDLAPGDCQAFWMKRTVPADVSVDYRFNFSSLALKALF